MADERAQDGPLISLCQRPHQRNHRLEAVAALLEAQPQVGVNRDGGRLVYIGAGTSGRLGVLDASECPPTFNTPPGLVVGWIAGGAEALTHAAEELEDSAAAGRTDAERLGINEADAVVGITASGRTPYVLGTIAHANEQRALTIGLACNPASALAAVVAIMIAPVVGPEVIAGSTRLKAGTAQKMVLNMLSTGTMILLGKTFGNLMVDLRATNSKLRRRAIRIVQAATDLEEDAAAALLQAAGGEVKSAIVAARADVSPEVARMRLSAAGGAEFVAAVDGGGSKTVAVVVDTEGHERGRAVAGSSNFTVVGAEQAAEHVRQAVSEATRSTGGELPPRALWVGLAGIDRPGAREALLPLLQPLAGEVRLTNDAELLFGALDGGVGVVLIAGTGSIALGRDATGTTVRAGGWGHLIGDEGSGYDLGRRALRAAAAGLDLLLTVGGEPARAMAEAAVQAGMAPASVLHLATSAEAASSSSRAASRSSRDPELSSTMSALAASVASRRLPCRNSIDLRRHR